MGAPAVQEFIDSLDEKTQKRVFFVLTMAKELGIIPKQYFKALVGTDGI